MAGRKAIKTTKEEIVNYWAGQVFEGTLSVDFSEAHERCWRCGCKRNLERCHIIPDSLGGEDKPENLVLLCKRCHLDNPNVADPEIMWDWLQAYSVPLYDTFWTLQGMKEYEKIYGISFREELKNREVTEKERGELEELVKNQFDKVSVHYGDPYYNVATFAGIFRMVLKEYDSRHGIKTTRNIRPYIRLREYF